MSDVPLTPYIECALEWWFRHEKWPPQAAELAERARMQVYRERDERKSAETLALYSRPALSQPPIAPLAIRREALRMAKAGEIPWKDLDGVVARLDAERKERDA